MDIKIEKPIFFKDENRIPQGTKFIDAFKMLSFYSFVIFNKTNEDRNTKPEVIWKII